VCPQRSRLAVEPGVSTKRAAAPATQRRAQLPGVNVEDTHDQNMGEEDEEDLHSSLQFAGQPETQ
jgi:hypothetical protein